MGERLFDPAEIARYNFEQFLKGVEGLSQEQVEKLIIEQQVSQVTKAAWKRGLTPEQLTAEKVGEFSKYGGTDHSNPWFT